MIGLRVSATHPDNPCPTGMASEENSRKFSPFTYSGTSVASRRT